MNLFRLAGRAFVALSPNQTRTLKRVGLAFAIVLTGMTASSMVMAQAFLPKWRCPDGEYRGPEAMN
jgi:hypothetical protein